MKKLLIGLALLTSISSFSATKEHTVNGESETYISANSSRGLDEKCHMLQAHLFRGFKALGQERMSFDYRITDRTNVKEGNGSVLKASGVCKVKWEESNSKEQFDASMRFENGEAIIEYVEKLVR